MTEPLEPEARARVRRASQEIVIQAKRLPLGLGLKLARAGAKLGVDEQTQAGDIFARNMAELLRELELEKDKRQSSGIDGSIERLTQPTTGE